MYIKSIKFDKDFMTRNKGTFVWQLMNMKTDKFAPDAPLAKNGRPDSLYQYYYYKNHFFEGFLEFLSVPAIDNSNPANAFHRRPLFRPPSLARK